MKKKQILRLMAGVFFIALMLVSCEGPPDPTMVETQETVDMVKQAQLRSYLESIVVDLANRPEAADTDFLNSLSKGPMLLNRVPGFQNANPNITIEETGKKYRLVVSRFSGSREASGSKIVFALDPDRFFYNQPVLGYRPVASSGVLQKGVRLEPEVIENLSPRMTVDYVLVFLDIEEVISFEESIEIWNTLKADSKIYNELKIRDVQTEICMDCEGEPGGGGGGGGGTGVTPGWYLVLTGIQLKWDHDSGADECEFYIREGENGTVRMLASHGFTGGYWNDAAGRYVRYPDLNNTGDYDYGTDIALWPLSDQTPVSIVGIEDDLNGSKHDSYEIHLTNPDGTTYHWATMYNEYRRPTNSVSYNVPRLFWVYQIFPYMDQDDIWQNSHFANFTLSNTPTTETWHELQDFKIRVKKAYIY